MGGKIFITGAAGKTGTALLELMFERGGVDKKGTATLHLPQGSDKEVTCLCRSDTCREHLSRFPISTVPGDASDAESLGRAYRGEEIVIHMSSIFHASAILEACHAVKRLIVVSSTGVFSRYRVAAKEINRCEALVESSGIPYTILRPTMIYGTPDDRNISKLVRYIAKHRLVPLPGGGKARFQPVHVRNLAGCILACLNRSESVGKSYNIPGGSAKSLKEIVGIIAGLLGKRVLTLPIPISPTLLAARILRLRIDPEQIERLREDKTFPYDAAAADLGYAPMTFEEGLRLQLEAMGHPPGEE